LGALLSTASAINTTLFGTARLGVVMAQESKLPDVFSHIVMTIFQENRPVPNNLACELEEKEALPGEEVAAIVRDS